MRMLPRPGVLAALLLAAAPAHGAFLDYLYIEANEGGSSGGHVALGVGDEVYHFQQESGGVLALRRDPRTVFRVRYTLLQNRPVHLVRLAADDATAERVRAAVAERLLIEDGERQRQAGLDADVALFALAAQTPATPAWPVRAAGYFLADGFVTGGDGEGTSPALAALRRRVAERDGADALPRGLAALRAELAALPLEVAPPSPAATLNVAPPTAATRLGELLEQITALEVLASAPALRPDALVAAPAPLTADERAALARFAARTSRALAALPSSSRPDWGWAMLLGMARLAGVEASLAQGRLLVLDGWPADAQRPPLPDGDQRAAFFAALGEHSATVLARQRTACLGGAPCAEADYARLESAANRAADVAAARAAQESPRVAPDPLLPARPALRRDLVVALPAPAEATRRWQAARTAADAYRDAVRAWRGYELVTRNCVTELFAIAESASGVEGGDRVAGQRATLGSAVARLPWNAIPFVAADGVGDSPRVIARETWPSYHQLARRRRLEREPGLAAWLAETTTVTAADYRPAATDSTFLFFTDDAVAARPLFGSANLAVASANGLLGLFTWPADGGARLQAGARGALYSLPELAFVNIRKGSTAWLTVEEVTALTEQWGGASAPLLY
ncbi:MAG TPA: hypothetical protein VL049_12710 [Candidatus Dormibacteraeota bacterium]|nr:hypothetical protein [Candidatus Dormibacteraeota bacterium]